MYFPSAGPETPVDTYLLQYLAVSDFLTFAYQICIISPSKSWRQGPWSTYCYILSAKHRRLLTYPAHLKRMTAPDSEREMLLVAKTHLAEHWAEIPDLLGLRDLCIYEPSCERPQPELCTTWQPHPHPSSWPPSRFYSKHVLFSTGLMFLGLK